jgi:hypothetical protein
MLKGRNDNRRFIAFSAEMTSGMGGGDLAALASLQLRIVDKGLPDNS